MKRQTTFGIALAGAVLYLALAVCLHSAALPLGAVGDADQSLAVNRYVIPDEKAVSGPLDAEERCQACADSGDWSAGVNDDQFHVWDAVLIEVAVDGGFKYITPAAPQIRSAGLQCGSIHCEALSGESDMDRRHGVNVDRGSASCFICAIVQNVDTSRRKHDGLRVNAPRLIASDRRLGRIAGPSNVNQDTDADEQHRYADTGS